MNVYYLRNKAKNRKNSQSFRCQLYFKFKKKSGFSYKVEIPTCFVSIFFPFPYRSISFSNLKLIFWSYKVRVIAQLHLTWTFRSIFPKLYYFNFIVTFCFFFILLYRLVVRYCWIYSCSVWVCIELLCAKH